MNTTDDPTKPLVTPTGRGTPRFLDRNDAEDFEDHWKDGGVDPLSTVLGILCFPCTLLNSCYTLPEREEAVILRWGKFESHEREPGMHFSNCWGRTIRRMPTKVTSYELHPTKVVEVNGNPIIVSGIVTYFIRNAKRAALDVTNVHSFVITQAQTALKQVVSRYPYECPQGVDLKNESTIVSQELQATLQGNVDVAGVKICGFQLNEVSFAPEIASAMLKRQQASAMVSARQIIVNGAVGIAYDAVEQMTQRGVTMTDSEKAHLATSILTVICSEHEVVPTMSVSSA
eukprot:CAMPEP_0177646372 /NCGR_PEP_ID=MMETSP0447-20121125/9740_1 /TAXON_ID=0 /ORGANISM="Stygamoeba regulata, Strain BSH-02190019" /LENGTH=286 /DNA_ID=CAMNT_0019148903 /DNA_START=48 /DNA_END=908 /DNA_ORIENTATION=+